MADLALSDFIQMVKTSGSRGSELLDLDPESVNVQVLDEDGNVYDVLNVKFSLATQSIVIEFDHDNDED